MVYCQRNALLTAHSYDYSGQPAATYSPSPRLQDVASQNGDQRSSVSPDTNRSAGLQYTFPNTPLINFNSPIPSRDLTLSTYASIPALAASDPTHSFAAFFTVFSACHPILPPLEKTKTLIREKNLIHLHSVIQFVGSFYIPSAPTSNFREDAGKLLLRQQLPKNGFSVQALLLFSIALHANAEEDACAQTLFSAISLALEIGMHREEFSTNFGEGCKILEESWRRTWWELYTMNAMFAGVNKSITFQLQHVAANVPLPCEEEQFLLGVRLRLPYYFERSTKFTRASLNRRHLIRIMMLLLLKKILFSPLTHIYSMQLEYLAGFSRSMWPILYSFPLWKWLKHLWQTGDSIYQKRSRILLLGMA